jgi:nitrogenase molybdenum-iron protein alpha/beta subunit
MDSAEVTEIKRFFDVVAERLHLEIRQVAEAVESVRSRLVSFRQEMHEQFEETRAMIWLEEGHSGLEARIERLEAR